MEQDPNHEAQSEANDITTEPVADAASPEPSTVVVPDRPRRAKFKKRESGWAGDSETESISADEPSVAEQPATEADRADAEHEPATSSPLPLSSLQPRRGAPFSFIVLVILIVIAIAIALVTRQANPANSLQNSPAVQPSQPAFAFEAGAVLQATRFSTGRVHLSEPIAAAVLRNGALVVADPGDKMVVLISQQGRILREIKGGALPFQAPYDVARYGSAFLVLDSDTGAISLFSSGGKYDRTLVQASNLLRSSRGFAVGSDGAVYVANPRTNSIITVSSTGVAKVLYSSPIVKSVNAILNQPSDIAAGANGNMLVIDNQNRVVHEMTLQGAFTNSWPLPIFDTLHSVHVIAQQGADLIASDPANGRLLFYAGPGRAPRARTIVLTGKDAGLIKVVGIAELGHNKLLVVDANGPLMTVNLG